MPVPSGLAARLALAAAACKYEHRTMSLNLSNSSATASLGLASRHTAYIKGPYCSDVRTRAVDLQCVIHVTESEMHRRAVHLIKSSVVISYVHYYVHEYEH